MKLLISIASTHPTIQFGARELARYLRLATRKDIPIVRPSEIGATDVVFRLAVEGQIPRNQPGAASNAVDRISIHPEGRGYALTGPNPRSVLFAIYRYLQKLGFLWIRPGTRGEIIPCLKSPLLKGLHIDEQPSYPYRTLCIEGAPSEQHVIDLIDWQTKQGMNGYFIQFEYGTTFWERWYTHKNNPYMRKEPFSKARVRKIVGRVIGELQKRDLRFERMGHGWTCAALGVDGEGWEASKNRIPAAKRAWLAKIKGKRDLFGGVPLNTNLCYSNPKVRAAIADKIVAYSIAHPEVTALHLWMADGLNNNCECPNCRKQRPADFYVDLLNELDISLTAQGLQTRIVFLIYVDLMWPPQRSRIRNPDRFILMFAPITRSYMQSFSEATRSTDRMTQYVRNKLQFPKGAGANIKYLRAWQKQFKGDCFDYDYHMIWPCFFDLSHVTLARILHKDIQALSAIGLHGFNSCQTQRQSFPSNLLMDVMVQGLWDKTLSFDEIVKTSFRNAYGTEGPRVAEWYKRMSALSLPFFDPVYVNGIDRKQIAASLRNIPQMRALAVAIQPLVKRHAHIGGAEGWSWKYLAQYLDILDLLLPAFDAYLRRGPDCRKKFEALFDLLWKREKILHPVLDVQLCVSTMSWRPNEMEEFVKKSKM